MKIFHVDMNSFFASCEQSINPELLGVPLVVCSNSDDYSGMVLAASYEAKAFGVKTTMLKKEVRRLCPNAVFVASQFSLYSNISQQVMDIFDEFTPKKEQASIDEAYLDMTGTEYLFGDSLNAAHLIQDKIFSQLKIGCSIGISTNKLLAKMASEMKKPMGITELYERDVPEKLWPLKVSQLYGVGKKTAEKLNSLGIELVSDLARAKPELLRRALGEASSYYLINAAHGIGSAEIDWAGKHTNQSIGNEITYSPDLNKMEDIKKELLFLSDTTSFRLRQAHVKAKCVSIKIKYSDFSVVTRSRSFALPSDSTDLIYDTAVGLFEDNWTSRPLRLLGVSLSNFGTETQLSLFSDESSHPSQTDCVMDALREKYGYDSISRGSLLGRRHFKL